MLSKVLLDHYFGYMGFPISELFVTQGSCLLCTRIILCFGLP
jgi:hypothetical protein